MNRTFLNKLTQIVLYEGYILYPYRPSIKNTQRFTFGTLYPKARTAAEPTDPNLMQTQVLIHGPAAATIEIAVRFLHLQNRTNTSPGMPGVTLPPWQESIEREVNLPPFPLADLLTTPHQHHFSYSHCSKTEPLHAPDGTLVTREQLPVEGLINIFAVGLAEKLTQLTVQILNATPTDALPTHDAALLLSFISTHTLLGVTGAEFLSLTDPPKEFESQAKTCKNIGTWPILVGTPPEKNTLLSSPIILPDYPQIAPESPGDLFDSTEIDEILTLRILTLTDEEKATAAATDDRVKKLLERTENLARAQMANLHGALRNPQPFSADSIPEWSPYDPDLDEQTHINQITTPSGHVLKPGDQVLLRPSKKADIFDLALAGKIATIVRIEQDFENKIHLAVTVNDDPGSDLGHAGKIGHRFFFGLEEVEPLAPATPSTEYSH